MGVVFDTFKTDRKTGTEEKTNTINGEMLRQVYITGLSLPHVNMQPEDLLLPTTEMQTILNAASAMANADKIIVTETCYDRDNNPFVLQSQHVVGRLVKDANGLVLGFSQAKMPAKPMQEDTYVYSTNAEMLNNLAEEQPLLNPFQQECKYSVAVYNCAAAKEHQEPFQPLEQQ
ncbi:MAG: hypothetical protein IJD48_01545 [Clostridia bacterium]|nr:hypothetical protein [Clostridia bacterium]